MRRLARTEREHGVRILLAVESGSRAWGFASPDSDFDVRFIYARPADWYLAVDLEERRDVIEYPITDEIDLNGWDLRKALRLFWRSNPGFVEWIQSPIVYREAGDFAARVRELLPTVYSCESGMHHYRSAARTTHREYLRREQILLKKYFYALRPLLAVQWIERHGTPAPIEFGRLVSLLEGQTQLLADIEMLHQRKTAAAESALSDPVEGIHSFIEAELARIERMAWSRADRADPLPALNALFAATLREVTQMRDSHA